MSNVNPYTNILPAPLPRFPFGMLAPYTGPYNVFNEYTNEYLLFATIEATIGENAFNIFLRCIKNDIWRENYANQKPPKIETEGLQHLYTLEPYWQTIINFVSFIQTEIIIAYRLSKNQQDGKAYILKVGELLNKDHESDMSYLEIIETLRVLRYQFEHYIFQVTGIPSELHAYIVNDLWEVYTTKAIYDLRIELINKSEFDQALSFIQQDPLAKKLQGFNLSDKQKQEIAFSSGYTVETTSKLN